ncbi:MAG: hypothetical protein P9L99_06595 [Candidatus Lernaella stagnicola]|nr:hypothetical protein [Candidatus Lernaella stagnicola]
MDRQNILARLHLHAVLPVLAKICEFDREAQDVTKDWNATIQFGYLGGPSAQLQFTGGKCRAYRQAAVKPDVNFWFPTATLLNNLFLGQGVTLPLINGFWNVKLIKGFIALTKRLEYYLKELDGQPLEGEIRQKVLTAKLSVATWATAILCEHDSAQAAFANHIPAGGTLNMIIAPEGPDFYFKKTGAGTFLAGDGKVADPTAELSFASPAIAMDLVNGAIDTMAALGKRDLVIRGLIPMVDDVSAVMENVESYLA